MGFQRKVYNIKFEAGHELHGLEFSARGMNIGELEIVGNMRTTAEGANSFDQVRPLVEIFSSKLIRWNYEDENGRPLGTSMEEIMKEGDVRDILPAIFTWVDEVGDVKAPLEKPSPSGEQSPEGSIPMEPLSPNPLS